MASYQHYRGAVLGPHGAGKTTMILKYLKINKMPPATTCCIQHFMKREFGGNNNYFCITDTIGQESYSSVNKKFVQNSNLIIILIPAHDQNPCSTLQKAMKDARSVIDLKNCVISVFVSKSDLTQFKPEEMLHTLEQSCPKSCSMFKNADVKYYMISALSGNNNDEAINDTFDRFLSLVESKKIKAPLHCFDEEESPKSKCYI